MQFALSPDIATTTASGGANVSHTVQRFEQHINGRTYHIEVACVHQQRWRAHVINEFGAPTALMPFYDATPDSAAQRLSDWLVRLHGAANASTAT